MISSESSDEELPTRPMHATPQKRKKSDTCKKTRKKKNTQSDTPDSKNSSRSSAVDDGKNACKPLRDGLNEAIANEAEQKCRMQTVTIALPGSIIDNAQTKELKTYLAGQIARAAVIFQVDEIVVYDDHLVQEYVNASQASKTLQRDAYDCHVFLMRILQYLETPQYLRKQLFPKHTDLSCAGLLNPLDTPHHVRSSESSLYREGVVSDRMLKDKEGSYVYVGLPKEAKVDKRIHPGIRVTVKLDQTTNNSKKLLGTLVSPSEPRQKTGIYWGYTCRFAPSLRHVWQECPYESGYDLKIGTSERGNQSTNDPAFSLPAFKHALIVFGGVAGIEECVGNDETISLSSEESHKLFDMWVNTCPSQGSRTIRTEEAVLISLSALMPHVSMSTGSLVNSS